MYFKIAKGIILILIFSVLQISFISGLPDWASKLNIIVLFLLLVLVNNFKGALAYAVGFGFICDIFSFAPFGIHLICLFLMVLVINFLLVNFFTDRSLYSFLALNFFGILFFNLSYFIYSWSFDFLGKRSEIINTSFVGFGEQIAINLVFAFILFHLATYMSKRFKPVFLVR